MENTINKTRADEIGVTVEDVAKIIVAAVYSLRDALGQDYAQPHEEAVKGVVSGIEYERENRSKGIFNSPEENHECWIQYRKDTGWVYGEKYNEEAKTHPDMIDYSELSEVAKAKNDIFLSIVDVFYPAAEYDTFGDDDNEVKEPTFGEIRMRVDPHSWSPDNTIDGQKRVIARSVDYLNKAVMMNPNADGEAKRLAATAMTDLEKASFLVTKALTSECLKEQSN